MSGFLLPVYIIIIVALIYFIGVRPHNRRSRETEQLLSLTPDESLSLTPDDIALTAPHLSAKISTSDGAALSGAHPGSLPGEQPERNPVEQLERLVRLRDSGSINDTEFETAKAELLKRV